MQSLTRSLRENSYLNEIMCLATMTDFEEERTNGLCDHDEPADDWLFEIFKDVVYHTNVC